MYKQIKEIVEQSKKINIAVVGDYSLDCYLYLDNNEQLFSDYVGDTIYCSKKRIAKPGGAGNVVKNLASLNINVTSIGLIGTDGAGWELKQLLMKYGVNIHGLISDERITTNTYYRPVIKNNSINDMPREIVLVNQSKINENLKKCLLKELSSIFSLMDAVVVVEQFFDEGTTVMFSELKEELMRLHKIFPNVICLVDSRYHIDSYKGVFLKCNQYELACIGKNWFDHLNQLHSIAVNRICELGKQYAIDTAGLFVTVGERGTIYMDSEYNSLHIQAIKVSGDIDVCGAGDSATAGIIIGLCVGMKPEQAALLGNIVASITIKKIGETGEAQYSDILDILSERKICI